MSNGQFDAASIGSGPIRPEQPAGEAVTYDPDFEFLKVEVGKLDSARGDVPNWDQIVSRGSGILQSKSKDLTVASFLALGLLHMRGFEGLRDGLTIYRDLLTHFWETLYPELKRMRGRVAAVTWLNDRTSAALARRGAGKRDHEAVTACLDSLREIDQLVAEKFVEDAPSLGDLRRALEDADRSSAPEAVVESAAAAASSSSAPSSSSAITIDSPDAADRVLCAARDEVKRAADYLLLADSSSPVPYRVIRGLAWDWICELPPDENGVTAVPAPETNLLEEWDKMVRGGEWKALLASAESRVGDNSFWIDPSRYVARSLEGMQYEDARRAVVEQCLHFTSRLPRILQLRFEGGAAFASEATRLWLETEAAAAGQGRFAHDAGRGAIALGGGRSVSENDPLREVSLEARKLAASGKLPQAVGLFQEKMSGPMAPRERFRWRLALSGLCFDAGQPLVAAAQLEALDQEIERRGLEEWEPELSLEVLRDLYNCQKKLGENGYGDAGDVNARQARLYARLCRLDVLSALALENRR